MGRSPLLLVSSSIAMTTPHIVHLAILLRCPPPPPLPQPLSLHAAAACHHHPDNAASITSPDNAVTGTPAAAPTTMVSPQMPGHAQSCHQLPFPSLTSCQCHHVGVAAFLARPSTLYSFLFEDTLKCLLPVEIKWVTRVMSPKEKETVAVMHTIGPALQDYGE